MFTLFACEAFTTGTAEVLLDARDQPHAAALWLDRTGDTGDYSIAGVGSGSGSGRPGDGHGESGDGESGDGESGGVAGEELGGLLTAPELRRWALLGQAMDAARPRRPHEYLMLAGVLPGYQGKGLGTGLLNHHHAQLDSSGTAAYLEATSAGSRALYARLGYRDHAAPLYPGGVAGPVLWPMWRPPARPATPRHGVRIDREFRTNATTPPWTHQP
jgi:GNAT superfamily N-acetyltransferase